MDYRLLSEQFLNNLYLLGKHKRTKEIGSSLKGEAFTLLFLALSERPVSPGELTGAMEISSARVAALLNALEKKGQIRREIDQEDRRKILIHLTGQGREKAEQMQECSARLTSMMLESLGEEDAQHLVRIVGKIKDFLPELSGRCEGKEAEDVIEDQC